MTGAIKRWDKLTTEICKTLLKNVNASLSNWENCPIKMTTNNLHMYLNSDINRIRIQDGRLCAHSPCCLKSIFDYEYIFKSNKTKKEFPRHGTIPLLSSLHSHEYHSSLHLVECDSLMPFTLLLLPFPCLYYERFGSGSPISI